MSGRDTDWRGPEEGACARPGGHAEPHLDDPASRRRFVQLVGATGGGAAISILLAACGGEEEDTQQAPDAEEPGQPANDLEIVDFVLFLEYLERDLYDQAIESGALRPEYGRLARQVRQNETEHVLALEGLARQLGGTPVRPPSTSFGSVIDAGEQRILETAATLENVGAAAYLGQVPRVENLAILEIALTIHSVEARHAAALNEIVGNGFAGGGRLTGSIPDGALAEPMKRQEVLEAAAPFIEA